MNLRGFLKALFAAPVVGVVVLADRVEFDSSTYPCIDKIDVIRIDSKTNHLVCHYGDQETYDLFDNGEPIEGLMHSANLQLQWLVSL